MVEYQRDGHGTVRQGGVKDGRRPVCFRIPPVPNPFLIAIRMQDPQIDADRTVTEPETDVDSVSSSRRDPHRAAHRQGVPVNGVACVGGVIHRTRVAGVGDHTPFIAVRG